MSRRLNIAAKFAVADVRPVPDPFNMGITFHIARIGVRDYQDWIAERSLSSPLYQSALRANMKSSVMGAKDDDERKGLLADEIDRLDFSKVRVRDMADNEGVARFLIRGIDGLAEVNGDGTEHPVEYTPEVGLELLSSTEPINEPIPNEDDSEKPIAAAATPLGVALREWVIHEANKAEKYRQSFMEEAGKN